MILNDNVNVRDHNEWLNPFIFIFQLVPAVGLFSFILFVVGLCSKPQLRFTGHHEKKLNKGLMMILILPFLFYSLALITLDTPFSRHLLPIIPLVCLLAAHGLGKMSEALLTKGRVKVFALLCVSLLTYQLAYTYSVQYYFDHDPRVSAQKWIKKNIPKGTSLATSKYMALPRGYHHVHYTKNFIDNVDYLVLHESYYYRYLRSELNPLRAAQDIEEVYRGKKENLENVTLLFEGKLPFKKVKSFEVKAFTPELLLYKKILGTFPQFLGDVLIYKRTPNA